MVLEAVWIGMRYTTAYGAIGSFIALLLWCYYGVSIFFLGAEYVQVLQDHAKATEVNSVLPQQDKSPLSLSQKLPEEAPIGPAIDRRTIPRRSRPRATGGSMLRRVA
jgi:hypothetical protein